MSKYVKYPKTFHVPWSESVNSDDKVTQHMDNFIGKRVIVTEKMDGENTTWYNDHIHARSLDSVNHPSRNYVKNMWAEIAHMIPEDIRICGENLYAKHSIGYNNLKSYFMAFSVWDGQNKCLDWDDTVVWFDLLGITSVPVLYDGIYDEKLIKGLYNSTYYYQKEGYVIRLADSFMYDDFNKSVVKFVRRHHVQTEEHWMHNRSFDINSLG